jgi:hypothetical protein
MANEIAVSVSITATKPAVLSGPVGRSVLGTFTWTGTLLSQGTVLVATGGTVIPLAAVTNPHFSVFVNHDLTNYVTIRNGSGGADLPKLYPGEFALIPLLETGDFRAVANNSAVLLEYFILSA